MSLLSFVPNGLIITSHEGLVYLLRQQCLLNLSCLSAICSNYHCTSTLIKQSPSSYLHLYYRILYPYRTLLNSNIIRIPLLRPINRIPGLPYHSSHLFIPTPFPDILLRETRIPTRIHLQRINRTCAIIHPQVQRSQKLLRHHDHVHPRVLCVRVCVWSFRGKVP